MTPYDFIKNNVKITVFDTPGLADGTGNDDRYLRQIVEKVTTVDLFLFCTDMTAKRFGNDDARTIKKLSKTFGASVWDHALVVLTFANEVHTLSHELHANERGYGDIYLLQQRVSHFQNQILRFQRKIQELLLNEGAHQDVVSSLPFVPAGKLSDPRLPDRDNWMTAFWIAAFKRINRNAKASFLLANLDRIMISCEGLLSDFKKDTERTRRDDGRRHSEDSIDEVNVWTPAGTLKRSSPVISTSEGRHYQGLLLRIQKRQLTLKMKNETVDDVLYASSYDNYNETKGSIRRSSALVTRDARERFLRRMQRKSQQPFSDANVPQNKTKDTGYKCVDVDSDDDCDDNDDDDDDECTSSRLSKRRPGRLSVAKRETEKYMYSPYEPAQTLYSLPPAYDEVVRNPVPLTMDDSSTQELFKEMVQEAISSKQTGEYVGVLMSQSGFGRLYAEFYAEIVEFVRRLLRRKKTEKAEM